MTRKPTALFAAAAIVGGLTAATALYAQEAQPPSQPSAQGMMGDHAGMMSMMGQTSPDDMKQMTAMIDNCNRMMESMNKSPTGSDK